MPFWLWTLRSVLNRFRPLPISRGTGCLWACAGAFPASLCCITIRIRATPLSAGGRGCSPTLLSRLLGQRSMRAFSGSRETNHHRRRSGLLRRQLPPLIITALPWTHDLRCHHSQCPSRRTSTRRVGPKTPSAAQSRNPRPRVGSSPYLAASDQQRRSTKVAQEP